MQVEKASAVGNFRQILFEVFSVTQYAVFSNKEHSARELRTGDRFTLAKPARIEAVFSS